MDDPIKTNSSIERKRGNIFIVEKSLKGIIMKKESKNDLTNLNVGWSQINLRSRFMAVISSFTL